MRMERKSEGGKGEGGGQEDKRSADITSVRFVSAAAPAVQQ